MSVTQASLLGDTFGSSASGTVPVGGIIMWSGSSVPTGWALCNGQTSNGVQTPDLRNRFIVGVDSITKSGVTTQTGSSPYDPGDIGGSADAVVVEHEHFVASSTGYESSGNDPKVELTSNKWVSTFGIGGTAEFEERRDYVLERSGDEANVGRTSSTGESETGKNLPPYYALAFIMRVS
jgi:microcystin-dependent protein